jgi:UDP-3-O-[3-hydroxymyristoyl] glucosamine N-acyltransferase
MNLRLTLNEISQLIPEAETDGDTSLEEIEGIASLESARTGDLAFLGNPKYKAQVASTMATLVLLPKDYPGQPNPNQLYLRMEEPSRGMAAICRFLEDRVFPSPPPEVHGSAIVDPSADIADGVSVGPLSYIGSNVTVGVNSTIGAHCHLGDHVQIGESCKLHPGVKILSRCEINDRVILNAGVVIGSEGYGFDQVGETHEKIPHLGKVVIEEDVEIGANTCIDRARFDETRIGAGTKIDNLVQIGHNVKIGKGCLIVAQVGISGSVEFEDYVVVGGQAGFAGHLKVGKGAKIAGQAGITKDVEAGAFLKGNPALPFQLAQRISVLQRKLPELFNRFAENPSTK